MKRALPAALATLICASLAATATTDLSPHAFAVTNWAKSALPIDIRPGGALKASSSFIQGPLKCADNVNAMLRANGYRGTGSSMARSFLEYGDAISDPRPGDIQVERRGRNPKAGHVQIVHERRNGILFCKNPSSRVGDWVIQPCANPRIIAYRRPTELQRIREPMYAMATPRPAEVRAVKGRSGAFPLTRDPGTQPAGVIGPDRIRIGIPSFVPDNVFSPMAFAVGVAR